MFYKTILLFMLFFVPIGLPTIPTQSVDLLLTETPQPPLFLLSPADVTVLPNGKISGVYLYNYIDHPDIWSVLRFYPHGIVVGIPIRANVCEKWKEISLWLNSDYSNRGEYTISDKFIRFKLHDKDATVKYGGEYAEYEIILDVYSELEGNFASARPYSPFQKVCR